MCRSGCYGCHFIGDVSVALRPTLIKSIFPSAKPYVYVMIFGNWVFIQRSLDRKSARTGHGNIRKKKLMRQPLSIFSGSKLHGPQAISAPQGSWQRDLRQVLIPWPIVSGYPASNGCFWTGNEGDLNCRSYRTQNIDSGFDSIPSNRNSLPIHVHGWLQTLFLSPESVRSPIAIDADVQKTDVSNNGCHVVILSVAHRFW